MRKPQISLLAVSVSVASLLLASTTTFANGNYKENYKGEAMPCPVELVLQDGLYVGAEVGYDNYRVVNEVDSSLISGESASATDPIFTLDPRLAANGAVGGLFIGYGKYFPEWYNAYLGLEVFGNWSAAQTDYELTVNGGTTATLDQWFTSVKAKDNFGVSALPGIKINNASLFYVRLGYNWAKVDIDQTFVDGSDGTTRNSDVHNTNGGFEYGVGIESTFMPGWSVRAEYRHTGFGNSDDDNGDDDDDNSGFGTDNAVSDNQFLLALIYHITI